MSEAEKANSTARVVIRGVRAVVLDDLPAAARAAVLEAAKPAESCEAWIAVASRSGQPGPAVEAYAGKSGAPGAKAGTYKAPAATSWFVPAVVIEPPLAS